MSSLTFVKVQVRLPSTELTCPAPAILLFCYDPRLDLLVKFFNKLGRLKNLGDIWLGSAWLIREWKNQANLWVTQSVAVW